MDAQSLNLAQRAVTALETMANPGMSAGDWVALGVGLSQCLLIAWGLWLMHKSNASREAQNALQQKRHEESTTTQQRLHEESTTTQQRRHEESTTTQQRLHEENMAAQAQHHEENMTAQQRRHEENMTAQQQHHEESIMALKELIRRTASKDAA